MMCATIGDLQDELLVLIIQEYCAMYADVGVMLRLRAVVVKRGAVHLHPHFCQALLSIRRPSSSASCLCIVHAPLSPMEQMTLISSI